MPMRFCVLWMASAAWLAAADPAGFAQWKGTELKRFEKKLGAKTDQKKIASEPLVNYGNHLVMMLHREGSGEAELHETQADIFIVQTGEATLVVGGSVVDPKTTALHEVRGPSIQDGVQKHLGPGDIVHIAAHTPHQLMVANGKQVTYTVVKIDSN
jgi:mannose-6-phosphate isomerase-like protein (cupin superfamily)